MEEETHQPEAVVSTTAPVSPVPEPINEEVQENLKEEDAQDSSTAAQDSSTTAQDPSTGVQDPSTAIQEDLTPVSVPVSEGGQIEMKLFVGRVPQSYESATLKPVFEEFGPVLEVAIIRDRASNQHKGSAFVRMASLTNADNAISELSNKKILDPALGPLQVRYAVGEAEKLGLTPDGASAGPSEAKLFIGCITKTATVDEVRAIFEPFGTSKEVFIMKDSATGISKGCAFIKFALKEQAILAINKLNGVYQMEGAPRPLEVRFAESKRTLNPQPAVMPAPMGRPPPVSPALFQNMGAPARPMNNYVPPAPVSNANPRQAGHWKEYHTQDGKCYYHNDMTNQTQWDRPLEFEQGTSMTSNVAGSAATGPPGANVFIFHVPNDWGYNELLSTFSVFGRIVSARLAIDKTSQRNKGFGFISYEDVNSAVQCVTQMNGCMVQNKRLKVTIKKGEEQFAASLMPPPGSVPTGQGMPGMAPGLIQSPRPQGAPPAMGVPHNISAGQGVAVQQFQQPMGGYRPPHNARYSPY